LPGQDIDYRIFADLIPGRAGVDEGFLKRGFAGYRSNYQYQKTTFSIKNEAFSEL
jgi:hypothetical protein